MTKIKGWTGKLPDSPELAEQTRSLYAAFNAHVVPLHDWYRSHAVWPRVFFRAAGMLVIIGSLSLPVLAARTFPGRDWWLSGVSLLVAALTGLNAFFRWDNTWRSRALTLRQIEGAIAQWDLQMQAFQLGRASWDDALAATRELFEQTLKSVSTETDQFFASIKFPDLGGRDK